MTEAIRICPKCKSERALAEAFCDNDLDGSPCGYLLVNEPVAVRGEGASQSAGADEVTVARAGNSAQLASRVCTNGHALGEGDQLCLICGAELASTSSAAPQPQPDRIEPTVIDNWRAVRPIHTSGDPWQRFEVVDSEGRAGVLTLYNRGAEPDPSVQDALRKVSKDHVPTLLAVGRFQELFYEVTEPLQHGSLSEARDGVATIAINDLVRQIGSAIHEFGSVGLRHRDLTPSAIFARAIDPLDLVVTSFGSARLSDFDLEAVAPLRLSYYSAPETIVGVVSEASDWWSLGLIVLERAAGGKFFQGVSEQAFHIQVVTRGVAIPSTLEPRVRSMLRGLLTRDPVKRWGWEELQRWLSGEDVPSTAEEATAEPDSGPSITFAGQEIRKPEDWAQVAAQPENWSAGRDLALRGSITNWLVSRRADQTVINRVRDLSLDDQLTEDQRFALILLVVNRNLPLIIRGEIVNPSWLLSHVDEAIDLITGKFAKNLRRLNRTDDLVQLGERLRAVRERAEQLDVKLNEDRLRIAALATSRANLEAERNRLRKLFPDSDHPALSALLDRPRPTDEDLIIVLTAEHSQYTPLATIIDRTKEVAKRAAVSLDENELLAFLSRPRRELLRFLDERTEGFARCDNELVDGWVEQFRSEKRLSLERALTALSVAPKTWKKPEKQEYISSLLRHFEKKVSIAVQRGPLVRFLIGKTTPRVDVKELETASLSAERIISHVIERTEAPINLDPTAFATAETLEPRLRHLINHATTFRRDTGIDGRQLGFPFLFARDSPATKPRIAPILLWPVAIDQQVGSRLTKVSFEQRDEVRLNPALEAILGKDRFLKWVAVKDDLLGRSALKIDDVVSAFEGAPADKTVVSIPGKDAMIDPGKAQIVVGGALFNAEFTGQAISADLHDIPRFSIANTALENALRVVEKPAPSTPTITEKDRYLTVESDPSQEIAVARARQAPGLLIEGPPGTGKSQTIVNIVADAIGRKETVLVVCQKLAAIKVVQKRLDAEGLGNRLFTISDVQKDRASVVREIREQLDQLGATEPESVVRAKRLRLENSARIELLEKEIDDYHRAIHSYDELSGGSYRQVLGELVAIDDSRNFIAAPKLRHQLESLTRDKVIAVAETCASLAGTWLRSNFEQSELTVLRQFAVDSAIEDEVSTALNRVIDAESNRLKVYQRTSDEYSTEDSAALLGWLDQHEQKFQRIEQIVRTATISWLGLLAPDESGISVGNQLVGRLAGLITTLSSFDTALFDVSISDKVVAMDEALLRRVLRDAALSTSRGSFFDRVLFRKYFATKRTNKALADLHEEVSQERQEALREAATLELQIRPIRQAANDIRSKLGLSRANATTIFNLRHNITQLRDLLQKALVIVEAIECCPLALDTDAIVQDDDATRVCIQGLRDAVERCDARNHTTNAVDGLAAWFEHEWIVSLRARLNDGDSVLENILGVNAALPTMGAFQRFRLRSQTLDTTCLAIFRVLRSVSDDLRKTVESELSGRISNSILREALLGWKLRIENREPALALDNNELWIKTQKLGEHDDAQRAYNRTVLSSDLRLTGARGSWNDITRLTGPRARRLRELISEGREIGLMEMRPIWLMNPDVASRILPKKQGFFDLVIYDEASQMLIEHAIPTLFRAKRFIVSGDEKQMPPSQFFATRMDSDEDDVELDIDDSEALSEAERVAHVEKWNRREIKDCPDLLHLGREVLPSTTLQVHYRSNYRELIGYSNAAFYGNSLSIPARHAEQEVRNAKPIEVYQVQGVYKNQTNAIEAKRVVEEARKIWMKAGAASPTIGIVTFNRKQADLIEDQLSALAEADSVFKTHLAREVDRIHEGEDVGFFVKNVENVQGDERDVIIFSTTFGRDEDGVFRRNFGVLGQVGGERRLNVAITRAKSKVIIVTSMPINKISELVGPTGLPSRPRDFLQGYFEYALRINGGLLQEAEAMVARFKSRAKVGQEAEVDGVTESVARFVKELGFTCKQINDGDAFGIDLAIVNPSTGHYAVGIECDAPRHPLLEKARAREIWRKKILERGIPTIYRVNSRSWLSDRIRQREMLAKVIRGAMGAKQ